MNLNQIQRIELPTISWAGPKTWSIKLVPVYVYEEQKVQVLTPSYGPVQGMLFKRIAGSDQEQPVFKLSEWKFQIQLVQPSLEHMIVSLRPELQLALKVEAIPCTEPLQKMPSHSELEEFAKAFQIAEDARLESR